MIERLLLDNFQSHEKTEIELVEGVNVIAGQSDSGKTAILRALTWIVFNRPSGNAFCSHWGGETVATVVFSNGRKIVRGKHKDKNWYGVQGEGGEDNEFRAFGTAVPETIQRELNLDNINFQRQLDPPFLVSETAGEVAKHFNRIANLQLIDQGVAKVNSKVSKLNSDISYLEERKGQLEEALAQYEGLDAIEKRLAKLAQLYQKSDGTKKDMDNLQNLCNTIDDIEWDIGRIMPIVALGDKVEEAFSLIASRNNLENTLEIVRKRQEDVKCLEQILNLEDEVNTAIKLKKDADTLFKLADGYAYELRLSNALTRLVELEGLVTEAFEYRDKRYDIRQLVDEIADVEKRIKVGEKWIKGATAKFDKLMPPTCPLCGSAQ